MEDNVQKKRINAFKEFNMEVKNHKFPQKKHSINMDRVELKKFKDKLIELNN